MTSPDNAEGQADTEASLDASVPATPQFAIIPGQDEIAAIDRDLRFCPVEHSAPCVLTVGQIEEFNTRGYLFPFNILDEDEACDYRDYFDRLLAKALASGGDSYSISSAHLSHGRVHDLLRHPRIVEVVADLLGDDVIGWGAHFFCKLPHDGKQVTWHQDCSYWPLTPSKSLTVWLAIDDADRENACMRFLPGSHREGLLPFRESSATEGNVLNQTVEGVERFGAPVDVELRAGQASIHSDLLLHGSEANDSDRRRCGLTLRYCSAEVRAHLGWHRKGVVVHGAPVEHWANTPRPVDE